MCQLFNKNFLSFRGIIMEDENFVWNLIFIGTIIERYRRKFQNIVIEWNFPLYEDLRSIMIVIGTKDSFALEKRYIPYSSIKELNRKETEEMVSSSIESMLKCMGFSI